MSEELEGVVAALHHVRGLKENVSNFVVPGYRNEVRRVLEVVDSLLAPHAPSVPEVLTTGTIPDSPATQVLDNMAHPESYQPMEETELRPKDVPSEEIQPQEQKEVKYG